MQKEKFDWFDILGPLIYLFVTSFSSFASLDMHRGRRPSAPWWWAVMVDVMLPFEASSPAVWLGSVWDQNVPWLNVKRADMSSAHHLLLLFFFFNISPLGCALFHVESKALGSIDLLLCPLVLHIFCPGQLQAYWSMSAAADKGSRCRVSSASILKS